MVASSPAPPGAPVGVVDVERRHVTEDARRLHVQEAGVDTAELAHASGTVNRGRTTQVMPGACLDAFEGLHEVGDGCHAYLQPDGGWGWSNAGLVVGDGASLLVDTLFDLRLTEQMLEAMRAVTAAAPIDTSSTPTPTATTATATSSSATPRSSPPRRTAQEMAELPPVGARRSEQRAGRGRRVVPRASSATSSSTASSWRCRSARSTAPRRRRSAARSS